jgi:hypothetical protein
MKGRSAATTPLTIVVFASAATRQLYTGSASLRIIFCAFEKLGSWPESQPLGSLQKLVVSCSCLSTSITACQRKLALLHFNFTF